MGVQVSRFFTRRLGAVPVFQVVADGVVVGHGVTGNEVVSIDLLYAAGGASNDNSQLAFVMHVLHIRRALGEGLVPDQRSLAFHESQRFFGGLEGEFFGMVGVIQAQRNDGARLRHRCERRQPNHVVKAHAMAFVRALGDEQLAVRFDGLLNGAGPSNACVFHGASP